MTNLSRKPCQVFTQKLSQTPRNSCQNFLHTCTGLLLVFCASFLLYGCLEICANCYSSNLSIKCCTTALENVPKPPRKYHKTFPRFMCKKTSHTDCTESVQYGLFTQLYFPSIFVPLFCYVRTQKSVQYDLFSELYSTSISVPTLMLYDLLNPYSTTCNKCCTFCLEMRASFQPRNACPSSAKMASFSNSNFCSLALSKMFHLPKNGCALLP
jgi:hypothetical protein